MAYKTLINRTPSALRVVLTVRKGDLPKLDAGSVEVRLGPAPTSGGKGGAEDTSVQGVTYGSASDIYLNAIAVTTLGDDAVAQTRDVVVERGTKLDRALNTNDTIEFLWDGHTVRISATNSASQPYVFPVGGAEASDVDDDRP